MLSSDTELDNDIKYVKEVLANCSKTYKNFGSSVNNLNKTAASRINFILLQFKNIFNIHQSMRI